MDQYNETFVAFDTSKLRNAVALAEGGRNGEIRYLGEIDNTPVAATKLVRRLAAKRGRLIFCYEAVPTGNVLGPLQGLKNRLAEFARAIVTDPNVAPNHGWRHRFKTVGMEAGIPPRSLDAIRGQAARSVLDTYGDVTVNTMAAAIAKLPYIVIVDRA